MGSEYHVNGRGTTKVALTGHYSPPLFRQIADAAQFVLDVGQGGDFGFGLFEVEAAGVVAVELGQGAALGVAFGEELVVVERAVVGGDAVEVAHVFGLGALFVGEKRLVHLLAVADADDLDVGLQLFGGGGEVAAPGVLRLAGEEFADGFGLGADGAGGGFLDQDVAVLAVLEGEEDQVNGFGERHDKAGHAGLGQGDGVAVAYLVDPQGDNGAARTHHIAVAGAADLGLAGIAALGDGDLLFDGFGDAHGIDGVGGFVGGEADDALHAGFDGGGEDVVGAFDVGLDGFHGEKLAGGHLLQCGGMEDVIDAGHGVAARLEVADVTDEELDLVGDLGHTGLIVVAHVVLFFLVAGEDADLGDVGLEEAGEDGVAEGAGAAGNHEGFACEDAHMGRVLFVFGEFEMGSTLPRGRSRYRGAWGRSARCSTSR